MKKSIINRLDKNCLCLGCGLCESICKKENVEMRLTEDGFFHPNVKFVRADCEEIIKKVCPGTNIINDFLFSKSEHIWGKIIGLYSGFSNDDEIRTKGSSGGIVSSIAIYLLQNKIVDSVLQVGGDENNYFRNSLKVSKTKEDVLKCTSSRYAPVLIFDRIIKILERNDDTYCFIGKPCDISALKNFLNEYTQYQNRIIVTIAIICAGMPSFNATECIIDNFNAQRPIKNLVYRGNGWPGNFSFIDKTGKKYNMSYNDSWGKVLGRDLHLRCKICPDGIGIQADIAVGDAWETEDGYPDFSEHEGKSLIIARTLKGNELIENAKVANSIQYKTIALQKIPVMQPYQFSRRQRVGIRILAFSIVNRKILNFRNLLLFYNATKLNPILLANEFFGTFIRTIKKKIKS